MATETWTSQRKIALFREMFRGREDVYPKRWTSSAKGISGYSPACANEWRRGICHKPRVRCSSCPARTYLPVTDRVVLDHLQGRHAIGVYPMLADDTCWFLAADFDDQGWLIHAGASLPKAERLPPLEHVASIPIEAARFTIACSSFGDTLAADGSFYDHLDGVHGMLETGPGVTVMLGGDGAASVSQPLRIPSQLPVDEKEIGSLSADTGRPPSRLDSGVRADRCLRHRARVPRHATWRWPREVADRLRAPPPSRPRCTGRSRG